jgi:acyl-CoA thioester hydrolase
MKTYCFKVYPGQCDPNGHMNTQFFVQAFDAASWELFEVLGCPGTMHGNSDGFGWADVKTELTYHRELRIGAQVAVDSYVRKIGRTSMQFQHEMKRAPDGQLIAVMSTTVVYLDLSKRCAAPISAQLIEAAGRCGLLPTGAEAGE